MHLWGWDWGWGWLAGIGVVLVLGILVLPWFFFLLNLHNLLERVSYENRAMTPALVWLNFVPLFCLGWFLYTVVKIKDSLRAEYASRRWPGPDEGVYHLGVATGVLWIVSFFLWWAPFLGWVCGIGWLVCWIMYWIKTAEIKSELASGPGVAGSQVAPARPRGPWAPPPGPGPVPGRGPGPAPGPEPGPAAEPRAGACAYCGTPYSPEDRFCRSCGLRLPKTDE